MSKIVKGSISDMAKRNNQTPAQSLLSCSLLVLLDVSYSMEEPDARGGQTRHSVARQELIHLQSTNEGEIALVCFSSTVQVCFDGVPVRANGGTNLAHGLESIKMIDGTGIKILVISDGEPDNESRALEVASTFVSPINTLYIGPERGTRGKSFLRELSAKSGGKSMESEEVGSLEDGVKLMLTAGK